MVTAGLALQRLRPKLGGEVRRSSRLVTRPHRILTARSPHPRSSRRTSRGASWIRSCCVRRHTVHEVCDFVAEDKGLQHSSKELLDKLHERSQDRKSEIRKEARRARQRASARSCSHTGLCCAASQVMTGLGEIFATHVTKSALRRGGRTAQTDASDEETRHASASRPVALPRDLREKLGGVPGTLLRSFTSMVNKSEHDLRTPLARHLRGSSPSEGRAAERARARAHDHADAQRDERLHRRAAADATAALDDANGPRQFCPRARASLFARPRQPARRSRWRLRPARSRRWTRRRRSSSSGSDATSSSSSSK